MSEKTWFDSPVGWIVIEEREGFVIRLDFTDGPAGNPSTTAKNSLLAETSRQLEEFFAGKRKQFDLALNPKGTEFQQKVWKALLSIPYGETRSYKQIAEAVNSPKAFRAVGMANNKNPISIIIPCHRVIGSAGKLVGYAGGLDTKQKLLELEQVTQKCLPQKTLQKCATNGKNKEKLSFDLVHKLGA